MRCLRGGILLAGVVGVVAAAPAGAQSDTLSLPAAVRGALATHPLVARAEAGLARAGARADQARAERIPRVTTDWSGMRHEEPMIVSPLHSLDLSDAPAFDRTLIQGNVGASWVLFDGGGRSARIDRAETSETLASEGVRAAEAELIAQTTRAYLAVLDARTTEGAIDAQIAALESERTRAIRLETEGRVAHVEVLRAEATLARAEADRAAVRARTASGEAELARLIGQSAAEVSARMLAVPADVAAVPAREPLIASALEANPEVAQARLAVAVAEAGRREAQSAFLPAVALAGRYIGYAGGSTSPTAEWQGGVQLSWPVFTGGQRGARVEEAGAEVAAARHELRLAELRTEQAVDDALVVLTEAIARMAALDAAVAQYAEVVDVEELALDAGAGVQTDFLVAQAALLESRTAAVRSRHAAIAARVALARATGTLTIDWIDSNLWRSP